MAHSGWFLTFRSPRGRNPRRLLAQTFHESEIKVFHKFQSILIADVFEFKHNFGARYHHQYQFPFTFRPQSYGQSASVQLAAYPQTVNFIRTLTYRARQQSEKIRMGIPHFSDNFHQNQSLHRAKHHHADVLLSASILARGLCGEPGRF